MDTRATNGYNHVSRRLHSPSQIRCTFYTFLLEPWIERCSDFYAQERNSFRWVWTRSLCFAYRLEPIRLGHDFRIGLEPLPSYHLQALVAPARTNSYPIGIILCHVSNVRMQQRHLQLCARCSIRIVDCEGSETLARCSLTEWP